MALHINFKCLPLILLLNMNKKLQAIRALKQRLLNMQGQLDKIITNQNQQEPPLDIRNYSSTPQCIRAPANSQWKNPTFWGGNPIFGKTHQKQNIKRKSREGSLELADDLKYLQEKTDENYYVQKKQPKTTSHKKQNQYVNYFQTKRYEHRFFEHRRQTPRFEKIKTYQQKAKNPILYPDYESTKGKRISPRKNEFKFTTSPQQGSRPNAFIFGLEDQTGSVSPKRKNNEKNKSPHMKTLLSASLQKIQSPRRKSCKKHYARYFKQTYGCKWV